MIPSEYHPVSITSAFSKVFECLLAKCLNAYAETNDLYPSLQFYFCKGLGTSDSLLEITSAVQKSLDTGCEVCMIGLDIIIAFLIGRKQRVVVDGQYIAMIIGM